MRSENSLGARDFETEFSAQNLASEASLMPQSRRAKETIRTKRKFQRPKGKPRAEAYVAQEKGGSFHMTRGKATATSFYC